MRRISNTGFMACFVLSVLLVPMSAQADSKDTQAMLKGEPIDLEDLDDHSLEDLLTITVSTATKSETTLEASPSIISVFTRRDIDALGVHQLADLLQYVPGFFEVSTQLEKNFAIRGIHSASAQHFVILIDGLPVNDFLTSTASPDAFSLDYVERVEIIRGPGSAIYGASALMGVINLITYTGMLEGERDAERQFRLILGPPGMLRGGFTGALDFGDKGNIFVAASAWASEGTSATVSGSEDMLLPRLGQNISDGLQEGENLNKPRKSNPVAIDKYGPSFDLFFKYTGKNTKLRINGGRNDAFLQRNIRQSLVNHDTALQPPRYVTHRLVIDPETNVGDVDEYGQFSLRTAVTVHAHEMRSERINQVFFQDPEIVRAPNNPANVVIYRWTGSDIRFLPSAEYRLNIPDLWILENANVIVGLQPEYNILTGYSQTNCFVNQQSNYTVPTSVYGTGKDVHCREELFLNEGFSTDEYGNATDDSSDHLGDADEWRLGGYAQYAVRFPYDISTVLGGRVDYHPKHGYQFSPRIALMAPLPFDLYSKFQYAKAFIYPALLYETGNVLALYSGVPSSPDVQPQSIDSLELLLGIKKDFLRIELNAYLNSVKDFITYDLRRNAQTGRYEYSNQGDLDIVGIENTTYLTLLEDRLRFHMSFAWLHPIEETTDEIFLVSGKLGGPTKSPEWMAGLVTHYMPIDKLTLMVSLLYSAPVVGQTVDEVQFTDIQGMNGGLYSSRAQDDYSTETILLNAALKYALHENWSVGIRGDNLFDRKHYRPGSLMVPLLLNGIRVTGDVTFRF